MRRLADLGYRTFDTDEGAFTVSVQSDPGTERLWREDRMQALLSATDADLIFVSGTCRNQVRFYPQFDRIVLLSAPPAVLVERLAMRTNNPYGSKPEEVAETLRFVETVEPLLRKAATLEVDTTAPLDEVVRTILQHVLE
ncbi:MAG: ATP-binding protein [Chloroflexi bacterium]|nr:MAG: ATP-binding protein [Chloroflexota bacterium]